MPVPLLACAQTLHMPHVERICKRLHAFTRTAHTTVAHRVPPLSLGALQHVGKRRGCLHTCLRNAHSAPMHHLFPHSRQSARNTCERLHAYPRTALAAHTLQVALHDVHGPLRVLVCPYDATHLSYVGLAPAPSCAGLLAWLATPHRVSKRCHRTLTRASPSGPL